MPSTPDRPKSPAQWRQLLQQWQRSGLTLAAFARNAGVTPGALSYWRRRFADEPTPPPRDEPALSFVPVTLTDAAALATPPGAPATAASFEIALPDGIALRVPSDFDADALRRLIATLRGPRC